MILLALLLAASSPTPAPATSPRLDADAAAVARAAVALDPHIEGASFDGKPGTDRLVAAQAQAMRRWVMDWLDLHPRGALDALATASERLRENWSISAIGRGRGDTLVPAAMG